MSLREESGRGNTAKHEITPTRENHNRSETGVRLEWDYSQHTRIDDNSIKDRYRYSERERERERAVVRETHTLSLYEPMMATF
jgi:hypothetical protein